MDILVRAIAWVLIGSVGLSVVLSPMLVGTQRKPYGKWLPVWAMFQGACYTLLCGRALGWW